MGRKKQHSDKEILATARECFLAEGPGVSTVAIAERVGMSQAALFKRFGTKADLLLAALAPEEPTRWLDLVNGGPDERPLREQLLEIARSIHSFFETRMPCLMALRYSGVTTEKMFERYPVPPPIRGLLALRDWFGRARARGMVREIDPESAATAFLGALHFRGFAAYVASNAPPAREGTEWESAVVDLLLEGLLPEEKRR